MLTLQPGNAQWIGTRSEQQDAFGFAGCSAQGANPPSGVLVVLADGMGGLREGRAASQLAVKTMLASYADQPSATPVPEALALALRAANRAVYALAGATAGVGQVGTTLVAAAVRDARLFWIGVGDSRLYLYRAADGSLTPCTEDHILANELWPQVIAGTLDADVLANHPDRDALTSFLGLAEIPLVDASCRPLTLQPGDRLLLCSDGVDGVLSREALKRPLATAPQRAAEALIAALRERALAHQDNATVAVLACESSGEMSSMASVRSRPSHGVRVAVVSVVLLLTLGAAAWFGLTEWRDRPPEDVPSSVTIPLPPPAADQPRAPAPETP